jgi:hypothetical protein
VFPRDTEGHEQTVRGPSARAVCVGRSPRRRARVELEHLRWRAIAREYFSSRRDGSRWSPVNGFLAVHWTPSTSDSWSISTRMTGARPPVSLARRPGSCTRYLRSSTPSLRTRVTRGSTRSPRPSIWGRREHLSDFSVRVGIGEPETTTTVPERETLDQTFVPGEETSCVASSPLPASYQLGRPEWSLAQRPPTARGGT